MVWLGGLYEAAAKHPPRLHEQREFHDAIGKYARDHWMRPEIAGLTCIMYPIDAPCSTHMRILFVGDSIAEQEKVCVDEHAEGDPWDAQYSRCAPVGALLHILGLPVGTPAHALLVVPLGNCAVLKIRSFRFG